MLPGVSFRLLTFGFALVSIAFTQPRVLEKAARLDAGKKCGESEILYRRGLAAGTPSASLLNNLGSHYLECGEPAKARDAFERLLKNNPAHVNANLQMAGLAIAAKDNASALKYLSRIDAPDDASIQFAIGMACGRMGLYERAESAFSGVLTRHPEDFDVLYNLGLAAARAGHTDRAQRAFETALKVRPGDADVLYELGRVASDRHDYTHAVYLLAQARKLAPQRADVMLALARAAQMAGFYGDSLLAYDDYLRLRPADEPNDDIVRRDRALLSGFRRDGWQQGIKDLASYVERHPNDAVGHYDLAQLLDRSDRAKSLAEVSLAIQLAPHLEPARLFRAKLLEQSGREDESITDLRDVVRQNPANARALDLLGLDYLNTGKPGEAEKVLRRAAQLSPDEPDVLFHLSRALMELGRAEEAKPFIARFQKLRGDQPRAGYRPREDAGMIEAATLSAAERDKRLIAQLTEGVERAPNDPAVRASLAGAFLAAGRVDLATAAFRDLLAMNPRAAVAEHAGVELLRYEQYALASDFLRRAVDEIPAASLDFAIALWFAGDAPQALKMLERAPEDKDRGDYLLLKARILETSGSVAEADKAIDESLHYAISRPRVAEDAALLLARRKRESRALEILGKAAEASPDDSGLMLARAIVLASAGRNADAEKAAKEVEKRWPEWDRPYLIEGLVLERESRTEEAKRRIGIAVTLGSQDPEGKRALERMKKTAKGAQ